MLLFWGRWLLAAGHVDGRKRGGRGLEDDGFGGADGFGIGGGDGSAFFGEIDGKGDELAESLVLLRGRAGGETEEAKGGDEELCAFVGATPNGREPALDAATGSHRFEPATNDERCQKDGIGVAHILRWQDIIHHLLNSGIDHDGRLRRSSNRQKGKGDGSSKAEKKKEFFHGDGSVVSKHPGQLPLRRFSLKLSRRALCYDSKSAMITHPVAWVLLSQHTSMLSCPHLSPSP